MSSVALALEQGHSTYLGFIHQTVLCHMPCQPVGIKKSIQDSVIVNEAKTTHNRYRREGREPADAPKNSQIGGRLHET